MNHSWIAPGLLALTLTLAAFPRLARAHEADDTHDHGRDALLVDRPDRYQTGRGGAVELRMGPYRPRVDSEFSSATPYADAFGSKRPLSVGLEADWQALRIPHFGSLGPGLGVHWVNRKGIAPLRDPDSTATSAHPDRLWIVPIYAVAVLRLDVLKRDLRIPLVPYIKGGFACAFWEARDAKNTSEVELDDGSTVKGQGFETGLQFQLGLAVHLNPLAPQAAADMDASTGVNDAYLFGEWWVSDIDSFGNGMQVGTNTWTLGLAIEF